MSLFRKKEKNDRLLVESRSIQDDRRNLLSLKSDFFIREAYKTLRTNVSFALGADEKCSVIVVTSSLQSEGKSITAINLAISYAMTDRKVLVVDCDLRRPKIARLMQLNAKVGLSNLLIDSKVKKEAIVPSGIENMDVLLSGSIPPNPSELLGSPRMQELIQELRESYDYIFLDSPPVNMVTDAVVLAPESDGVLFLVRANKSERGAIAHAIKQLEYGKTKILGFVLNGVDLEKTHYGDKKYRYRRYFRYGRYGYGYGKYGYGYGKYGYGYGKYGYGSYSSNSFAPPNTQPEDELKVD